MSHHWRANQTRAEIIQNAGDHDAEYFGGWAVSGLATLGVVLMVWHFGI